MQLHSLLYDYPWPRRPLSRLSQSSWVALCGSIWLCCSFLPSSKGPGICQVKQHWSRGQGSCKEDSAEEWCFKGHQMCWDLVWLTSAEANSSGDGCHWKGFAEPKKMYRCWSGGRESERKTQGRASGFQEKGKARDDWLIWMLFSRQLHSLGRFLSWAGCSHQWYGPAGIWH